MSFGMHRFKMGVDFISYPAHKPLSTNCEYSISDDGVMLYAHLAVDKSLIRVRFGH